MFTVACPIRAATVLIWPSQVAGINPTEDGLELHFRCDCGQPSVLVTGRTRHHEALLHPSSAAQPIAA